MMVHEVIGEVKRTDKYVIKKVRLYIDGVDNNRSTEMDMAFTLDDKYIGNTDTAKVICDKFGITPEYRDETSNICSIGFCEKDKKWYSWSHRAIAGFGIGSKVTKKSVGYRPGTVDELYDDLTRGMDDKEKACVTKLEKSVRIQTKTVRAVDPNDDNTAYVPAASQYTEYEIGRGEWEAKTLEDAKQMAIDFAEGVS